ncbi:MAG: branched-chain amino acid ABC transporter permease [Rhodoferax sp.]|uniref:branched-chain amino acid ABC transporter permease n=1 Tax=Rhodoferax sp. TaxID=50421 RepID=UPI00261505AC|nr:branched-chain amino acid ABC transporter permease [Rhodoferax sp.]MDD5333951.1 branched-chain amino acid ABC transporter permease [Rhodoferax sp.]
MKLSPLAQGKFQSVFWAALPVVGLVAAWMLVDNRRLLALTVLNGLTLAGLYFLVASGFTLVFGLMRVVNLAHGSLFLLGGYVGYSAGLASGSWLVALLAGFVAAALAGVLMQGLAFNRMVGQDLRQTLATIGLSIMMADIFLWLWGGDTYQFDAPDWLTGTVALPLVHKYAEFRLVVLALSCVIGLGLWLLLHRTRVGMMIRAGVDDKDMLSSVGVNVERLFLVTFAIGAGLAGLAGVVGGTALSVAPGEDVRYLLASLVVVLVGGMGSITGAALGALLIGLAETFGQTYAPTYGVVFTFVIMVAALAFRPNGLMGKPA